jgi:hypothetical protein
MTTGSDLRLYKYIQSSSGFNCFKVMSCQGLCRRFISMIYIFFYLANNHSMYVHP